MRTKRSTKSHAITIGSWRYVVSLAAVFSIVTQRSSPQNGEERCVTILKSAARETRRYEVYIANREGIPHF